MLARQCRARDFSGKQLTVGLARNLHEVREAQRLRYQVFAEELGARVPGHEQGIDCDLFDAYCEHLLVRDGRTREVVGTYRMLSGRQAVRAGGFYSEQEFDLARLAALQDATIEVGRSCVHRDYRDGAVISLLWSGLGTYMVQQRCRYVLGCASISMGDGGSAAAAIYERLAQTRLSPAAFRVTPRRPLPHARRAEAAPSLPALIKGYARLGAWVCGAPAWDPDFNTADLLLLLPLAQVDARYARRFMPGLVN